MFQVDAKDFHRRTRTVALAVVVMLGYAAVAYAMIANRQRLELASSGEFIRLPSVEDAQQATGLMFEYRLNDRATVSVRLKPKSLDEKRETECVAIVRIEAIRTLSEVVQGGIPFSREEYSRSLEDQTNRQLGLPSGAKLVRSAMPIVNDANE